MISQKIIEKNNNSILTRDPSVKNQDYYYKKSCEDNNNSNNNINLDKNNNLFFKNYVYGSGSDNTMKSEVKSSFLNYSRNPISADNNNEKNTNLFNNNNYNKENFAEFSTLFEYEKFKENYDKINLNKKLKKSNSNIDSMFMNTNKFYI